MLLFKEQSPSDPNDDYYKCLCGVSVHRFVLGISIFEILSGFAMLLALFAVDVVKLAPAGVIVICMGLLLMWGNRRMVWWAYVFELCQWICSAFMNFVISGCVIFYAISVIFFNMDYIYNEQEMDMHATDRFEENTFIAFLILLAGLLHLTLSLVFAYFTCVLIRAFQYVYNFGDKHERFEKEVESD